MFQTVTGPRSCAADEELIDTLIAISVVSRRLARRLTLLAGQRQSTEGGKRDEQNGRDEQNSRYQQRPAQMRCCWMWLQILTDAKKRDCCISVQ